MPYLSHPDPSQLRAWLDAGLAAHRAGEVDNALTAYRRILAVAPENGPALNLLGTGLLQLGRAAEGVAYLERAVRRQRDNPGVLANLAQAYLALKRYGEASEAFRKASRIAPAEPQFHVGAATALALQGRVGEAAALLQRLSSRFPQAPIVWFNLGNVLREVKEHERAIAAYRKALELDPQFPDALNNLGSTLHSVLRFGEAEAAYRQCIAIAPDHLPARYNLASVVMDEGRFADSEAICREIVAMAPSAHEGYTILGAAVGHQGRLFETLAYHGEAARLAPGNAKALEVYAAALMGTGHHAAGLRGFARALSLAPDDADRRDLLGSMLRAHGMLQDGWACYDMRPAARRFREKYPTLALTRELPRALEGETVCVLREQGLGDEIFFLRWAATLAARGARVTYRASNRIASLVARIAGIDTLLAETAALPPARATLLAGDLPHATGALEQCALRDLAQELPRRPDYPHCIALYWPPVPVSVAIAPSAQRAGALAERLASSGPAPYIGITWRAGTQPEEQTTGAWVLYKNAPLEKLGAAMRNVHGTLIALQRKPKAGEIEALSEASGKTVHDFTAVNDDLEDILALLSLIDDYVTVSNTNVHLRAAAGRTARVLVPVPAEWRWLKSGSESPWFPGFALYRQSLQGDWRDALAALECDLTANYGKARRSDHG